MAKHITLTGIKPTGTPHIGNYFGAIKPAIEMSKNGGSQYFYFIADYHALNSTPSALELTQRTKEIACAWLACGLDPEKVVFYRQSDIPQVFELNWILNNVTPKGVMNRAHAYKEASDSNLKQDKPVDEGINMGLYCYPILMAADIMLFDADTVPVGKDQTQHVEMAREMARSFNSLYGLGKKDAILVEASEMITPAVAVVPGIDGRKMSKSYNNIVPLFSTESELKKLIMSIKTDSTGVNDPKSTDCILFDYYKLFATKEEAALMAKRFADGISWGETKKELFEKANAALSGIREKYNYYMQNFDEVKDILRKGAEKARPVAEHTLERVRKALGSIL